jgi:molybdopterin converting factor subunit 1
VTVTLLLFAQCREAAGRSALQLEVDDGTSISELWGTLEQVCPALGRFRQSSRIAVNREFASDTTRIAAGDELALIPPVSGG